MEQLKGVCSALEECEGFNSEGWIKSRVAGKKRSTIDLYLKQVALGKGAEEGAGLMLDEGAGIFMNHMQEYDKMEEELQMYPAVIGLQLWGEGLTCWMLNMLCTAGAMCIYLPYSCLILRAGCNPSWLPCHPSVISITLCQVDLYHIAGLEAYKVLHCSATLFRPSGCGKSLTHSPKWFICMVDFVTATFGVIVAVNDL